MLSLNQKLLQQATKDKDDKTALLKTLNVFEAVKVNPELLQVVMETVVILWQQHFHSLQEIFRTPIQSEQPHLHNLR